MSGHPVPHICSASRLFSYQRLVGVMVPEVCGFQRFTVGVIRRSGIGLGGAL